MLRLQIRLIQPSLLSALAKHMPVWVDGHMGKDRITIQIQNTEH